MGRPSESAADRQAVTAVGRPSETAADRQADLSASEPETAAMYIQEPEKAVLLAELQVLLPAEFLHRSWNKMIRRR